MESLNLLPEIMTALKRMKILSPTEIQKQTIPVAMQGRDILASSQTGSGKTLAYLVPLISSILENKSKALVLVPTRELATQVRDALVQISGILRISSAIIIGGEPMAKQYSRLNGNPKVIIGTPGRIIDHLNRKSLKLNEVGVVVLDEMDRMLDMGMKEQLEEIVKFLPEQKQVMMFSATMPKHIIALSHKYLNNPHHVTIGSASKPASSIKQESIRLSLKEKLPKLLDLLTEREGSVIIFTKTKRGADELAKNLKAESIRCDAIHGDLRQSRRDRVLLSFRKSSIRILVATDVAARGLDIPHTEMVVNYDLPMSPEDYLHRIGRTGRAGAEGTAVSFVTADETAKWRAIEKLINHGETTSREELMGPKKSRSSSNHSNNYRGSRQNSGQNFGNVRRERSFGNAKSRRDESGKDFGRGDRFANRSENTGSRFDNKFEGRFNNDSRSSDRTVANSDSRRENHVRGNERGKDRFASNDVRTKERKEGSHKENMGRRGEPKGNDNRGSFFASDRNSRNDQNDKNRKFGESNRRRERA